MTSRKGTRWMRFRLVLVVGLLLIGAAAMVYRISHLQLAQADWLKGLAKDQYLKEITLEPMRGPILDRNGVSMAESVMTDSIFVVPREVTAPQETARKLAAALALPQKRMIARMSSGKSFAWIKRRVGSVESERVRALKLPGVHFTRESRRFYPAREMAAAVIGFAGDGKGLEGIELLYDTHLRGEPVMAQGLRDARGNLLFAEDALAEEALRGGGVVLTLDLTIQEIVETELQRTLQRTGAKAATAIVLVPSTGEILAMANVPGFNPNTYSKAESEHWRNRAVTDCYEPGSTMKVFTFGAALQRGLTRATEVIHCEQGSFQIGGRTIHDSEPQGHADLTVRDILAYSSNIGAAKIGMRLGKDALFQDLRRFGFGNKTGVDLPGEARCVLRRPETWSTVGLANIAFGQGVSVSALQLVSALGAVANGGVWMRPLIVRELRSPKNEVIQHLDAEPGGRVLDERWGKELVHMMVAVTEPGGTGEQAAIPGFRVAGKTGTAQKADPATGGYSHDKRVASFMGFAPVDHPRIAALVVVDEPSTSPYGGVVAAPAFARIAEATLRYLRVTPEDGEAYLGGSTAVWIPAGDKASPLGGVAPAPGAPREPSPAPAVRPAPATPAEAATSGDRLLVPDVRGLSAREAMLRLSEVGLTATVLGSGRVRLQSPEPGAKAARFGAVALTLERCGDKACEGREVAVARGQGGKR